MNKWGDGGGGLENSPKFNRLFDFQGRFFLFSSIQNEYISWKLGLDGISSKIQEIRKNDLLRPNNKNVLQNSNNTQYTVGQSTFN